MMKLKHQVDERVQADLKQVNESSQACVKKMAAARYTKELAPQLDKQRKAEVSAQMQYRMSWPLPPDNPASYAAATCIQDCLGPKPQGDDTVMFCTKDCMNKNLLNLEKRGARWSPAKFAQLTGHQKEDLENLHLLEAKAAFEAGEAERLHELHGNLKRKAHRAQRQVNQTAHHLHERRAALGKARSRLQEAKAFNEALSREQGQRLKQLHTQRVLEEERRQKQAKFDEEARAASIRVEGQMKLNKELADKQRLEMEARIAKENLQAEASQAMEKMKLIESEIKDKVAPSFLQRSGASFA